MKRYFYISDNLESLKRFEDALECSGVTLPQLHILSGDDAQVQLQKLHGVEAVMQKDVVRGTQWGAALGLVLAAIVLIAAGMSGTAQNTGWWPIIFLAIVTLGFCTWEGGLFGIQEPHYQFRRFKSALAAGKHIMFIDAAEEQEAIVKDTATAYADVQFLSLDRAVPAWVIYCQNRWHRFIEVMP